MSGYFPSPFFASAYMPGLYWRPDETTPPTPTTSSSGVSRLIRSRLNYGDFFQGAKLADDDETIMAVIAAFLQKVR